MNNLLVINFSYVLSAFLFILGLKKLSHPLTARSGNLLSALGMFISILVTMFHQDIISYKVLVACMGAGAVVGFFAARVVAMTSMPEMVALFNGFGGIASLLVGMAAFYDSGDHGVVVAASILIGGVTFTGSIFAWAKLKGLGASSLTFLGQQFVNGAFVILTITSVVVFVQDYLFFIDPLYAVVSFFSSHGNTCCRAHWWR